jgi:hypothetical protein
VAAATGLPTAAYVMTVAGIDKMTVIASWVFPLGIAIF